MKQFWIFSLWLSLASCLMGCQEDETAQTAQRWGYLSLPDVSVQVENLNLLPTRTASDEDPLTVEIRQGEEVVKSYASDVLPEKIELEPGLYTLCVYNDSHGKPWVAPGTPDYFYTPEDAMKCIFLGAHAVVVGSAITRPHLITKRFTDLLTGYQNDWRKAERSKH